MSTLGEAAAWNHSRGAAALPPGSLDIWGGRSQPNRLVWIEAMKGTLESISYQLQMIRDNGKKEEKNVDMAEVAEQQLIIYTELVRTLPTLLFLPPYISDFVYGFFFSSRLPYLFFKFFLAPGMVLYFISVWDTSVNDGIVRRRTLSKRETSSFMGEIEVKPKVTRVNKRVIGT